MRVCMCVFTYVCVELQVTGVANTYDTGRKGVGNAVEKKAGPATGFAHHSDGLNYIIKVSVKKCGEA